MAQECKVGGWLYRIDPSDNKKLQSRSVGSTNYGGFWMAPNGEKIFDVSARGDDLLISTDRHNYVRKKSGNITCVS